jgi:low temperature requirement protein LtrA
MTATATSPSAESFPQPFAEREEREEREATRKVTWLELFFDLVFVAAVSQVADPLREHYDVSGLLRFTVLFALIWWAWTGYANFVTRFGADDVSQRLLTLLQMFIVAAMAANADDTLDSRSTAGLAAAYAALRLILIVQYVRARHVSHARPLTLRYSAGHGSAALIWLLSAVVPIPVRYWLWMVAFAVDLGTPWVALTHTLRAPPHSAHLPERFGLFTLILLGEAVVAVMRGMKSQAEWHPQAAITAFVGMGLLFMVWWWYFDVAKAASERPVRTRRDIVRLHIWSYSHFPLYLAIVALGVGLQRAVTAAGYRTLPSGDTVMLAIAVAFLIVSLGCTRAMCVPRPRISSLCVRVALGLVLLIAASAWAPLTRPVLVIPALLTICIIQIPGPKS